MQDKRVLVTGGSAGLGAAIAKRLAASGARCAINFANDVERARATLESLPGKGHILVQGSVFTQKEARLVVRVRKWDMLHRVCLSLPVLAEFAGTQQLLGSMQQPDIGALLYLQQTVANLQTATEGLGGLDCVASNAGWTKFGRLDDLEAIADEDWDRCYAANVKSHLWVMQEAKSDLERNNGSFLIIASIAGMKASGSSMAYGVSKAAAIHLGVYLAKACAPKIVVNSISPGLLDTEWSKGFTSEQFRMVEDSSALGKLADLEDCAKLAEELLLTRSITGQNIEVSAGFRL